VLPLVDLPPSDGGTLIVQAAQLSPGTVFLQGDAGATTVSFGAEGEAGPFAQLTGEGDLEPSPPQIFALTGGSASLGQVGFAVDVAGPDASDAGHLWMSLTESLRLVEPLEDPATYYGSGGTYVVAIVGDPSAPRAYTPDEDAAYDGTGLHVLVVRTAAPPADAAATQTQMR